MKYFSQKQAYVQSIKTQPEDRKEFNCFLNDKTLLCGLE